MATDIDGTGAMNECALSRPERDDHVYMDMVERSKERSIAQDF